MFKDKEQTKIKITDHSEQVENVGSIGAENQVSAPPNESAPQSTESPAQSNKSASTARPSSRQPQSEPPHRQRAPLPWWRAHLQPVVVIALTIVAVPMTFLHLEQSGDEWLDRSQTEKAKSAYMRELARNHRDWHAADRLARIAVLENRPRDAVGFFNQELALNPAKSDEVVRLRGLCSLQIKEYASALSDLEHLTKQDLYTKLGRIDALVGLRRLQEASALANGLSNDPQKRGWNNTWGEARSARRKYYLFMRAHDYQKALKLCDNNLQPESKSNFKNWEWTLLKGDVLFEMGDYKKALAVYHKVPRDIITPTSLANEGAILRSLGDLEGSIKCYEQAIKQEVTAPTYGKTFDMRLKWQTAIAEMEAARGNRDALNKAKTAISTLANQDKLSHGQPTFGTTDVNDPSMSLVARLFGDF